MNEAEAEKFIEGVVNKLLWQRLLLIASLVGIANLIAFISLWKNINDDAHKVASDQVKKSAIEYAEKAFDKFTEITNEAKKRVEALDTDYASLYKRIGGTDVQLTQLQSSEKTIEGSLAELSNQTTKLLTSVQATQASDAQHALTIIDTLRGLPPDQKQLVDALVALPPRVVRLESGLAEERSIRQKAYDDLRKVILGP
jgi:septal ring factor EnvC (AmiA/AmiB activator)